MKHQFIMAGRSILEKAGTPIGPLDMLIGAHAQSLDVI